MYTPNRVKRSAAIAAAAAIILTGCGKINSTDDEPESSLGSSLSESVSEKESSSAADTESERKPAHASIGDNGAKAVTDVLLFPHEDVDISHKVSFEDMYGIHVLHSGVVGLVGAPIDVEFDTKEIDGGRLVFVYDPQQLKGVRPDALMFLWYDEENGNYVEMTDGELHTENCSMTLEIDKPGVYLLVNMYTWLNVWGADLDDDGYEEGYDPSKEPIDGDLWAKHENVGDIPDMADEEYISSCRQDDGSYVFEVSEPAQLASAVYFVNCKDENGEIPVTIELTQDIDLDGISWAPMGWYAAGVDYSFSGEVIGNGHTIRNMTIDSNDQAGFIGTGNYCQIIGLNFENASVKGSEPAVIVSYAKSCIISQCSVQGSTEGYCAGSVVGRNQSSYISDCEVDVTANGEDMGDFFSGSEKEQAAVSQKNPPAETIWLDDMDRPTREEGLENEYSNIGWLILRDGVQVLHRSAENETSLPWQDYPLISESGHYSVTLTAFIDGYYIPISNTVEYDVE